MTDRSHPERAEPQDQDMNESSRRKFLLGAASLAAGALASETASAAGGASDAGIGCEDRRGGLIVGPDGRVRCCDKPTIEEANRYAGAMLASALSTVYREKLLTFGSSAGASINWKDYSAEQKSTMLGDTWNALKEAGALPDKNVKYVVLSSEQFENNVYFMQEESEKVLRLPSILFFPFWPLDTDARFKGDVEQILQADTVLTANAALQAAAQTVQSHICGM